MDKKCYLAPCAELLMLIPGEDVASNWFWGVYAPGENASGVTSADVTVWDKAWDYSQSDESYKIN